MNIFEALNIFYREDVISDFLKNCFEDSRHFLNKFLKSADIQIDDNYNYKVINRMGLGKTIGTPDIVIYETEKQIPKIIVIENKLGTGEGIEQTIRYESKMAQERILRRLNLEAGIPQKRLGTPEEVAELVTFLLTSKAEYINGEVIRIDGGFTNTK